MTQKWSSNKIVHSDEARSNRVSRYTMKEVTPPSPRRKLLAPDEIGGQLEAIEREAYQRGFETGEHAGRELGFKEMETANRVLSSLIDELKDLKEDLLKASESDILNAVMTVCRRILREEVSLPPDRLVELVQESIQKIGKNDAFLIRLNPADHTRISKDRPRFLEGLDEIQWLRMEPDPSLLPGECMIETTRRIVDARIGSQLDIMEEAFFKSLDES